jgi:hypothetical protein
MISSEKGIVISLYDYSGIFVKPWIEAGYTAIICDIQHKQGFLRDIEYPNLYRAGVDLRFGWTLPIPENVVFVAGFSPCTDTAVSGAKHFRGKGMRALALACDLFSSTQELADKIGCPYMCEQPVSTIASYAGEPDYYFEPYEYGGYLPEDDKHPLYPEYIKPRDAYPKKTCLWTGNGFVMPPKKKVRWESGYSLQFQKLGGKSQKTKNIRSATPRGFAKAVFQYNNPDALKNRIPELQELNLFNT